MSSHSISRRRFIQSGLTATAALSAVRPALGAPGANDRIRIAMIGTGGRGLSHIGSMAKHKAKDIDLVAICDVDDAQLDKASKLTEQKMGSIPKRYKDYRDVINLKDVDAVLIATPCHWHAIPAIEAMKAGKDVYLEKPSGHTIHECKLIADTAKQTDRIVQIGTQQRSGPHWMNAVERIKAGELGQITSVRLWNQWGLKQLGGNLGNPPDSDTPAGVDYDMWLGPAPKRPFNPARFHFGFYFFSDYSTGMTIAWGVHLFDVATWAMGPTLKSAAAHGGIYVLKDARDTPDTLDASFDCGGHVMHYSLGHTMEWPAFGKADHGMEFIGTEGVLQISRLGFDMFREDARVTRKPYYSEKHGGDDTEKHQANFFECMRSRKQPNSDAQAGYDAALPGLLALISRRLGRSVRWDAEKHTIAGDAEAARLLTKEYRAPWKL